MGGSRSIDCRIESVSPTMAKRMLENVINGSKSDQLSVLAFASDMKEGKWVLNGAPIVVSTDGKILDGRVRLLACLQSNTSFVTMIVEGVDAAAFETIDALRKRTFADILMLRRERHGRPLGSALKILRVYEGGGTPGTGRSPAPTALLEVLEKHPRIRESIMPALDAVPLLPHGCGIALHYLASAIDPVRANQFMNRLQTSSSAFLDDPIIHLRNALIDLRKQDRPNKQTHILAISIKAMNAFFAGKPVRSLQYTSDKEKFPRLTNGKDRNFNIQSTSLNLKSKIFSVKADIRVEIEIIDPNTARRMLGNPDSEENYNRNLSLAVVSKYARDMEAGRWRLNGQTIKFGSSGKLLDGQHRLKAVIQANKSIQTMVVYGLSEDVLHSIDIGRKRAASEVLRKMGEANTIILASALRWYWMISKDITFSRALSPSIGEILEILNKNPDIRCSIRTVSGIRKFFSVSIAAASHYHFSREDLDCANKFFDSLISGANLSDGGPILRLRDEIIGNRIRLTDADRARRIASAWNTFMGRNIMEPRGPRNRIIVAGPPSSHPQV